MIGPAEYGWRVYIFDGEGRLQSGGGRLCCRCHRHRCDGYCVAHRGTGRLAIVQVSALFGIKGLHFIYPLLNRGVTAAVGGGGDNARISGPKHP